MAGGGGRVRRAATLVAVAGVASGSGWYMSSVASRERVRTQHSPVFDQARQAKYRHVGTVGGVDVDGWGRQAPIRTEHGAMIELWSPPSRESQVARLKDEEFDVLVIGGGATGSGLALDAAGRGLKVALVEGEDFACGTSSRSTKLIHGGIRYLLLTFQTKLPASFVDLFANATFNPANFSVLKNDLYERAHMIASAPFMTKPLPMMVPMYKWWEVPVLWMGGKLYDAVAGSRRIVPASHYMSVDEAVHRFPTLKQTDEDGRSLKGCLVLYDGQMNDARMNLNIALTAVQGGAVAANHVKVESLLSEGGAPGDDGYRITGAVCTDAVAGATGGEDAAATAPFNIRAKLVVNATGPYSDAVRKMADPAAQDIIVPSQGAHLILPDYLSPENMGFVRMTSDGRVLYFLPWEGSTIVGTTDATAEIESLPRATDTEVSFIIREANAVLNRPVTRSQIRATWAGLRPLVRKPDASGETKEIARDHVVDVVAGGLVTVCGGKWTTYRRMAEDGLNKALELNEELNRAAKPCATLDSQLLGSDREGLVCGGDFSKVTAVLREEYNLSKDVAAHLLSNYGTRSLAVAMLAKERLGESTLWDYPKLAFRYPMLEAEVIYACKNEFATTV